MVGVDEKTQEVALVTPADRVTGPPADASVPGVAKKLVTVGAAGVLETNGAALAARVTVVALADATGAASRPAISARPHPTRMETLLRRPRLPSAIVTPAPPEVARPFIKNRGKSCMEGQLSPWKPRRVAQSVLYVPVPPTPTTSVGVSDWVGVSESEVVVPFPSSPSPL